MVVELTINKPVDLIKELEIPKGSFVFHLPFYRFDERELEYNMYVINLMKKNKIIDEKTNIYFLHHDSWYKDNKINVYKFDNLIAKIQIKNARVRNKIILNLLNNYSFYFYHYGEFNKLKEDFIDFFFINDRNVNQGLYKFLIDYSDFRNGNKELSKNSIELFSNVGFFTSGYALYGLYNQYGEVNSKFKKDLKSMIDEALLIIDNSFKVIKGMKFENHSEAKEILYSYMLKNYSYLEDRLVYMLGTKDYTDPKLIYHGKYRYFYDYFENLSVKRGNNLEEALIKRFLYESLRDTNLLNSFYNNVKRIKGFFTDDVFAEAYPYQTYLKYFSPDIKNLNNLEHFITTINNKRFFDAFYETHLKNFNFLSDLNETYKKFYTEEIFEKRDKFYKSIGREIGL